MSAHAATPEEASVLGTLGLTPEELRKARR